VEIKGFGLIIIAAGFQRSLPVPLHGVGSDRDDRDAP
jgi:hypothetical protein